MLFLQIPVNSTVNSIFMTEFHDYVHIFSSAEIIQPAPNRSTYDLKAKSISNKNALFREIAHKAT